MPKKITKEEFIEKLNKINCNIDIVSEYINMTTKVLCRCLIDECGYEWYATPHKLLLGTGCPMCGIKSRATKQTKTYEQFVDEIKIINPNIQIIGNYINANTKIKCNCLIHNKEFSMTPNNLLQGKGCPICAIQRRSNKRRKSYDEFVSEMAQINPNIIIIGEYKGAKTKIKCQCRIDGNIFMAQPSNLLQGFGCPICNNSKGEKRISYLLNQYKVEYISQYKFDNCKHIRPLPFDFYLPKYNMCIEYDGLQHYEPVCFGDRSIEQSKYSFEQQKIKDNIKTQYCQENKIKLLRIPYWDFNNIESILNKELNELYSRCS